MTELKLSHTLIPENQLRFLILSFVSTSEIFFIVISKFNKGFSIVKFVGDSMKALSQVDTKGHLKQIFFSTMLSGPLTAFAFFTI